MTFPKRITLCQRLRYPFSSLLETTDTRSASRFHEDSLVDSAAEAAASRVSTESWVISREEVTLTKELLGSGAYVEVRIALFQAHSKQFSIGQAKKWVWFDWSGQKMGVVIQVGVSWCECGISNGLGL